MKHRAEGQRRRRATVGYGLFRLPGGARLVATCADAPSADTSDAATISPERHATAHFQVSGHPIIASFEPGEVWFYDYKTEQLDGPTLAPPRWHPEDQPVPGPKGLVPHDWQTQLNANRSFRPTFPFDSMLSITQHLAEIQRQAFLLPPYFDYAATFLWAISGALLGARRGYAILGIATVALVSSTGGGPLRDGIFLQRVPMLIRTPVYLYLIVTAGLYSSRSSDGACNGCRT